MSHKNFNKFKVVVDKYSYICFFLIEDRQCKKIILQDCHVIVEDSTGIHGLLNKVFVIKYLNLFSFRFLLLCASKINEPNGFCFITTEYIVKISFNCF